MADKQSAIKRWTDKNAQLWQVMKFFAFSMCSGATQGVTFFVLGALVLIPLHSKALPPIDFWVFHYDSGMLYDLVAYFVSVMAGNMISFALNRKKTFKSASNITYAITATLIMILFIIVYSTVLGPKLDVWLGELIPWFNTSATTVAIRDFAGQTIMSFFTMCFVFLMDKFVILPESKEAKAEKKARKAAAEANEALIATKKVVNEALAKKFLISALVLFVAGIILLVAGNVSYTGGDTAPTTAVIAALISGSVIFGIGEIVFFFFVAEKLGDEVEV